MFKNCKTCRYADKLENEPVCLYILHEGQRKPTENDTDTACGAWAPKLRLKAAERLKRSKIYGF